MQGTQLERRVGFFVLATLGLFIYMGFQVGAFRFNSGNYNHYIIPFNDSAGLGRKAEVKIAGVKVGWVESLELIHIDDVPQVHARIMMNKDYTLYHDAYGVVRQDGLLGSKFVEIAPGTRSSGIASDGTIVTVAACGHTSIDALVKQCSDIASNVKIVTERLALFVDKVDQSSACRQDNIDAFLEVGSNVRQVCKQFDEEVLPTFCRTADQITTAVEEASLQARDGMRGITSVADKIDEGKGLIGKLINENDTYRDLRVAVCGIKNYLTKLERLEVVFDAHCEAMLRVAENYTHRDSKGYMEVRLHPCEDYFYLIQLTSSQKGFVCRDEEHRAYNDLCGNPVNVNDLQLCDDDRLEFVFQRKNELFKRNTLKLGLQFGKIYSDLALRFGLFEGSAGAAADYDIPFCTDHFRWVTTMEMFDLSGWNRKDDRRPHLKWINRMFIFNTVYFVFGADDFASRCNSSFFFGGGLRFGDDEVKYLLAGLSACAAAVVAS